MGEADVRPRRKRYNPDEFAREGLAFPPIDLRKLGSPELVGYHSYLNWLVPELTLGRSLRLSLLLFDKVIAETDFDDLPERMLYRLAAEGKLTRKACRKLLGLIVPITRIVPKFGTWDLVRPPADVFLDSVTEHVIDEEYTSKGQTPPAFEAGRSLQDLRYKVTVAAFENWFALSRQTACLFIPNDYEERILRDFLTFLSSHRDPSSGPDYRRFRSVITRLLPAIDELSLEEVLALRQHEYFASFRVKTRQLVDRVSSADDAAEADRVIEEEERRDVKALQDLFRPRPLRTLLRAIIGNVPLPSLVNPVALYDAAAAVRRELKAAREVGWLYFVRDLKERRG